MHRLLVVQKYGGTSVGSLDRIRHVAKKIEQIRKTGTQVVGVVSAVFLFEWIIMNIILVYFMPASFLILYE